MLGETIFTQQIGEIALSKTTYAPAMVMDAHAHEFAYVSLVVDGHYAEHSASAPRHLKRGMLVFHPAGEVHADCVLDQTMATVNVEFLAGNVPGEFICADGAQVDEIIRRLLSGLPGSGRALLRAVEALGDFLWTQTSRVRPSERMISACNALEEAASIRPIASLAAELGLHRAQLHRAFKRAHGESPRAELTKRRVAVAARLLVESPESVAAIAAACGFYDQSHLCRQFKLGSGMSPSQYRVAFAR